MSQTILRTSHTTLATAPTWSQKLSLTPSAFSPSVTAMIALIAVVAATAFSSRAVSHKRRCVSSWPPIRVTWSSAVCSRLRVYSMSVSSPEETAVS